MIGIPDTFKNILLVFVEAVKCVCINMKEFSKIIHYWNPFPKMMNSIDKVPTPNCCKYKLLSADFFST